jgi:integrase/recombinase XerD
VKSLLGFDHRLGYLPFDVGRVVKRPKLKDTLAERILSEGERPSPHWLRHAHATHAVERGAAIDLVQATLGHISVATAGRYLHARPTDSSARNLPV